MKQIFIAGGLSLIFFACANGNNSQKTAQTDTIKSDTTRVAPVDDAAELIAATLKIEVDAEIAATPDLIPADQRKFNYHAVDLNNDGKDEYLVAPLPYSYFCGSGGCTVFLINGEGHVITHFTVVRFPVLVAESRSEDYNDLILHSGGQNRWAKMKGGSYPSNPSLCPVAPENEVQQAKKVLDIDNGSYPTFTF